MATQRRALVQRDINIIQAMPIITCCSNGKGIHSGAVRGLSF